MSATAVLTFSFADVSPSASCSCGVSAGGIAPSGIGDSAGAPPCPPIIANISCSAGVGPLPPRVGIFAIVFFLSVVMYSVLVYNISQIWVRWYIIRVAPPCHYLI